MSLVMTTLTKVLTEHPGDTAPGSLSLVFKRAIGADDVSDSSKYGLSQLFKMELH